MADLATDRGYGSVRCDVQDLKYAGQEIHYNGTPIDVAYLKFDTVVDGSGEIDLGIYGPEDGLRTDFFDAIHDRAFVYINSWPSQLIAENKRTLALIKWNVIQCHLTSAEISAIDKLVAETHSLSLDGLERFGGCERLRSEKDRWVLKAVLETRGRGVFIGRYKSDSEWNQLLSSLNLDRFVVQEFIDLDTIEVTSPISEPFGTFKGYSDIGLFLLSGQPVGFLGRASRLPVVNVGNGGALRPTFVVGGT